MRKKKPVIYALIVLFSCLSLVKIISSPQDTNEQFETFTDTLFRQELASNTLSLHYTLKNPETFQIDENEISLGTYETDSLSSSAAVENCLAVLNSFSYDQLSSENQITYGALKAHLETALQLAPYTLYDEPLRPLTGIQAQLPILLSEFPFYSESDINTYLALLKELPDYFDSLIAFEQAKYDANLFMSASSIYDLIEECQTFLALGENHYLYSSFENRLNALNLTDSASIENYIIQNEQILKDFVFPSYQKLISYLSRLAPNASSTGNLCNYPDGKNYYEILVYQQTGSSRSIPELKELITSQIQEDLSIIHENINSAAMEEVISFSLQNSDPVSILLTLKDKTYSAFPSPPEVRTTVKYVQEEMEEFLSPAFYMIPAIDNIENNTIYINRSHLPDDLDLFTTLAHEGYPGHLYQTTYYASTNPAPIRSLLDFGGYTEGWATYAEYISYYFTGLPKAQASLLQHNDSLILGLYSLADIGIHYDDWSLHDTICFFNKYGITNTESIQNIYQLIIGDPANYLKYYVGYLEFLELKEEAIRIKGKNFTEKDFHEAVLSVGPAPFSLLGDGVFLNFLRP